MIIHLRKAKTSYIKGATTRLFKLPSQKFFPVQQLLFCLVREENQRLSQNNSFANYLLRAVNENNKLQPFVKNSKIISVK